MSEPAAALGAPRRPPDRRTIGINDAARAAARRQEQVSTMANRLQVIYIEDDALVRRASVQSLQLAGFDVAGFESAEAAEGDRRG